MKCTGCETRDIILCSLNIWMIWVPIHSWDTYIYVSKTYILKPIFLCFIVILYRNFPRWMFVRYLSDFHQIISSELRSEIQMKSINYNEDQEVMMHKACVRRVWRRCNYVIFYQTNFPNFSINLLLVLYLSALGHPKYIPSRYVSSYYLECSRIIIYPPG